MYQFSSIIYHSLLMIWNCDSAVPLVATRHYGRHGPPLATAAIDLGPNTVFPEFRSYSTTGKARNLANLPWVLGTIFSY